MFRGERAARQGGNDKDKEDVSIASLHPESLMNM